MHGDLSFPDNNVFHSEDFEQRWASRNLHLPLYYADSWGFFFSSYLFPFYTALSFFFSKEFVHAETPLINMYEGPVRAKVMAVHWPRWRPFTDLSVSPCSPRASSTTNQQPSKLSVITVKSCLNKASYLEGTPCSLSSNFLARPCCSSRRLF